MFSVYKKELQSFFYTPFAYVITALADDRARYLIGADILCDGGCVNNGYGMLTATKRYDERSLNENW